MIDICDVNLTSIKKDLRSTITGPGIQLSARVLTQMCEVLDSVRSTRLTENRKQIEHAKSRLCLACLDEGAQSMKMAIGSVKLQPQFILTSNQNNQHLSWRSLAVETPSLQQLF